MKWKFVVVGKPSLQYARLGIEEYLKRLQKYTAAELITVQNGNQDEESGRLLKGSEGSYRIVFDERGESLDTQQLTRKIDGLEMDGGCKLVSVLIGGADGHSQQVKEAADCIISLGKMTIQHELALLVAVEQIYRVYTIKRGEPYHRQNFRFEATHPESLFLEYRSI